MKVPGVGGSWFPFFAPPITGDVKQWGSRIIYLVKNRSLLKMVSLIVLVLGAIFFSGW